MSGQLYEGDATIRLRKAGFTVASHPVGLRATHPTTNAFPHYFYKYDGAYSADKIDAAIAQAKRKA